MDSSIGTTRAIPVDRGSIGERFVERGAEDKRDIFNRVVLVDLQIAGAADLEVEEAMMAERGEQVVVEPDTGLGRRATRPVEGEADRDVGLARLPGDGHRPRRGFDEPEIAEGGDHAAASSAAISRAAAMSRSLRRESWTVNLR